jgi:hypothetical protein
VTVTPEVISNDSHRPIRDVTCLIFPDGPGGRDLKPLQLGVIEDDHLTAEFELVLCDPRALSSWPVMRPGFRYGFLFDFAIPADDAARPERTVALPVTRFTRDVGLSWEIDGDLRLKRVESRSRWTRLSAALNPDRLLERLYLGR